MISKSKNTVKPTIGIELVIRITPSQRGTHIFAKRVLQMHENLIQQRYRMLDNENSSNN